MFGACLCVALDTGAIAGFFWQRLAAGRPRFRRGFAGGLGHFAKDELGESGGGADAEAGIGVAHLLAEAVDECRGVDGNAGFSDLAIGDAIHADVRLDRLSEEPVEEVGEGDLELPSDFGDGSATFEDVGEHVGGELRHGIAPVGVEGRGGGCRVAL